MYQKMPYDWVREQDFPLKDAHAALVGEMLEAEMEAEATVEKLREIEALWDQALGGGRR
jgi:hypothetical protein